MSPIIKNLKLPDENYKFFTNNETKNCIENLSKLNIFIGQNNSGKSRLMRTILSENEIEFLPNSQEITSLNPNFLKPEDKGKDIIEILKNGICKIKGYNNTVFKKNDEPFLNEIKEFPSIDYLKSNSNEHVKYYNDLKEYANNKMDIGQSSTVEGWTITRKNYDQFSDYLDKCFDNYDLSKLNLSFNFLKVYIPILRGLIPLMNNNEIMFKEDIYYNRVINDYFKDYEENEDFHIFSGLTVYEDIKRSLLGNLQQRNSIREFEFYLSENFFDGKEVTLIPKLNDVGENDILNIKIGDEKEYSIYELGDGIQTIIIITFPLFQYSVNLKENENVLFFIEEPELNLHPGLQRKLMETLLENPKFDNFQFFITTHSNHLLDLSMDYDDVSIFSVQKKLNEKEENDEKLAKFEIKNVKNNEILNEIGVRPSSLMFSNCFIWVEGKYDRLYLQHCLNLYKEYNKEHEDDFHYTEDQHYSFFQYEGDNLSHWSIFDEKDKMQIDKLFKNIFIIHDKDKNKESLHSKLSQKLNKNYYPLNCREIENLVSKELLIRIIKSYSKINPKINIKINEDFTENDFKDEKMEKFIYETILSEISIPELFKFDKDDSKKYRLKKNNFSRKAIELTNSYENLTDDAKDVTEEIVKFIKNSNKIG